MVFIAGAEVAVLCITKSGEVLNYQAFTNAKGIYTVAETMPESDRWDACLARPISSFHEHCTHLGDGSTGIKFSYNHPSGYSHAVRTFIYRPASVPTYCIWKLKPYRLGVYSCWNLYYAWAENKSEKDVVDMYHQYVLCCFVVTIQCACLCWLST